MSNKDTIQMDAICRIRARVAVGEETELLLEAVRPIPARVKPDWSFRAQTPPSKPQAHSAARVRELRLSLPEEDIAQNSRNQGGAFGLLCGLGGVRQGVDPKDGPAIYPETGQIFPRSCTEKWRKFWARRISK